MCSSFAKSATEDRCVLREDGLDGLDVLDGANGAINGALFENEDEDEDEDDEEARACWANWLKRVSSPSWEDQTAIS